MKSKLLKNKTDNIVIEIHDEFNKMPLDLQRKMMERQSQVQYLHIQWLWHQTQRQKDHTADDDGKR